VASSVGWVACGIWQVAGSGWRAAEIMTSVYLKARGLCQSPQAVWAFFQFQDSSAEDEIPDLIAF